MNAERRPRLLIVNPNTDARVTRWLAEETRRVAGEKFEVVAINADSGLAAIQTPEDISIAARAVKAVVAAHPEAGLAIIAAFGDPGLGDVRALGLMPVIGLGETGLRAAGAGGRRFSVVTLGAAMRDPILARAASLGLGQQLAAVHVLPFSIAEMVRDRDARRAEIAAAIRAQAGEAILLGGAPFAGQVVWLAAETGMVVLDGVAACVEAATLALLKTRREPDFAPPQPRG